MGIAKLTLKNKNVDAIREFILDESADRIFEDSQRNIVAKKIIDEGTLLKSGNINRFPGKRQIVYPVPWADVIEFGRLPGSMPPIEPIQAWVKRKVGIRDEKESLSFAWAIAMDIKKNGQDARPYLQPAIKKFENERIGK